MISTIPLLEHDYGGTRNALSRGPFPANGGDFPSRCVISFMGDVIDDYVQEYQCELLAIHHSEVRDFPIYHRVIDGTDVAFIQGAVGAPAAAILADRLVASGVTSLISCGGCGVLYTIDAGKLLVVSSALRDEGTSYHYVEPSREIYLERDVIQAVEETMAQEALSFEEIKVWTTDGFFRETDRIIALRKEEGCQAVDMEVSALAALAQAYGVRYGALLYSGDSLSTPGKHDPRNWLGNKGARRAIFEVAIKTLIAMK